MRRTRLLLLLLGTSLLLGACAETTGPSPQPTAAPPTSIGITASTDTVQLGGQFDFDNAVSW
jgi:hypothetical protein